MGPVASVVPVFLVIALGWSINRFWRLGAEFRYQANALVYYVAVPVLIFDTVARAPFQEAFRPDMVKGTVGAVLISWVVAWVVGSRIMGITGGRLGTFLQNSFHGNTGYVGLAMVYYVLGAEALQKAGILAGFLILVNNSLALLSLVCTARNGTCLDLRKMVRTLLGNPILWAAFAGLACSAAQVVFPLFVTRTFGIVSDMALPVALVLIGASISRQSFGATFVPSLASSTVKLALLPAVGLLLYRAYGSQPIDVAVGVVLLAAPSATLAYVMAGELGGDQELASGAVSLSTMMAAASYPVWIAILHA